MAKRRTNGSSGVRRIVPALLCLLLLGAGCDAVDVGGRLDGVMAALRRAEPTATIAHTAEPATMASPTREAVPEAAAPTVAPTSTPVPTATPAPTATATATISMLVGPAVPWLTVQAYTSTPRPAYVAATPPEGPALATIPPRSFPGEAAPTWTPAPTAFPVLPGQPDTATPSGPVLELLSVADFVDEATGELVVTGEVRNISEDTVTGVRAVVNLYDVQDQLLGSASEPLVFPSLSPDQRSPFAVAQAARPQRSHFTIQFLDGTGRLLETLDATG
jgi:hypothetical protein